MARVLLAKARRFGYGQEEIVAPLGLLYVAAVLRQAGHQVSVYDCGRNWNDPERFRRALLAERPDVVGLSAITYEGPVMEGMARLCRETLPGVPVIAGGSHPSAYPERCARAVDYVVIGEGERTAVELVGALTRGERDPRSVHGVAWFDEARGAAAYAPAREPIEDLDALPFPAWDLVDPGIYWRSDPLSGMARRPYMLLLTSRGCPYRCIYCHEVLGKRFRARSPDNVLREMALIRARYGVDDFEIIDDVFNLDRARMVALLGRLGASPRRPKLHFPNGLRADLLDAELIRLLRRAGALTLHAAIETTSPRLQRLARKNLNVERVGENIALAVEQGLYVVGFFMLGFPTETYEEARATVAWALRTRLHHAHFNIVTPFAGTALYDHCRDVLSARGLDQTDIYEQSFHKGSLNLSAMSDEQLFGLQQEAYRRWILDPRRAARILLRHPGRTVLLSKALLALYYALPLGRARRERHEALAWRSAPLSAGPGGLEPARRGVAAGRSGQP
jgi:radical SAM superfamily enzyme YgiQ (UPF0313 family)